MGTYIVDDSADRGTSLGVAGLMLGVGLGLESCVSNAVIVVKAAQGHLVEIVELHHDFDCNVFD